MKKTLLISIIVLSIFTTGCWDMIEINNRIYPYTVGYDLIEAQDGRYRITFSYPNIAALGKNPSSDDKIFVVETNADNMFSAMHKLTSKINNPIYLKHLKVILLTEKVALNDRMMKEIVDGISRDFIVNKNAEMLLVKEDANKVLSSVNKLERQESVEGILYSMLLNQQHSSMFSPVTVTNFVENMDLSNGAIVPFGHLKDDEIHIDGGAVFKDYKLIGYITGHEFRAISYLNNQIKNDGIENKFNDSNLSLMISNSKSKKKLVSKDKNLKIKYTVELEGHIHSYTVDDSIDKIEKLEAMQDSVAKMIKAEFEKSIEKMQKELKVDVLFISHYLNKYHPNLWEEIKDDWEEIYPEIEIEIEVNVFIRRRGLTI